MKGDEKICKKNGCILSKIELRAKNLKKGVQMINHKLWTKQREIDFFTKSLEIATPEQLFYTTKVKKKKPCKF